MQVDQTKKTVLITGAGRGIGAATAKLFAESGYQVCVNYRQDEKSAAAVVSQLQKIGANCIAVKADVAIEADVVQLFEKVDKSLGTVTVLVNNAGILLPQMRL